MRGLKQKEEKFITEIPPSHPVWVRGLKLKQVIKSFRITLVAPRVGAWIETQSILKVANTLLSHPVWVRGLKLGAGIVGGAGLLSHPVWVRGLKHRFECWYVDI